MTETTEIIVNDTHAGTVDVPVVLTKKSLKNGEYIPALGRRKTATATVRLTPASQTKITINGKDLEHYFTIPAHQKSIMAPFHKLKLSDEFSVSVVVRGSGIAAQAEAVRHGIARALTEFAHELRTPLKRSGYLKRDPRSKERRKPGLKKARKASQWSKR